jgi:hypothetical protein
MQRNRMDALCPPALPLDKPLGCPSGMTGHVETAEECLREAEECERLAGLARSTATRQIMTVVAIKWRKLAEKAAERNPAGSFVWPRRSRP